MEPVMPDWFLSTMVFTIIATVLAISLAHASSDASNFNDYP